LVNVGKVRIFRLSFLIRDIPFDRVIESGL
jgi:hypothetical protein